MNSNKNKLNNKIIFIFHFNPNAHSSLFWVLKPKLDRSEFKFYTDVMWLNIDSRTAVDRKSVV